MAEWNTLGVGDGGLVRTDRGLRFVNPPTADHRYTNAQIDDYQGRRRSDFRWRPPVTLTVCARFSHPAGVLGGTAGFGFWNDPFLMTERRLPTLPRAVWFFYASPPSDMALALDVPGWGWKAACLDAHHGRALAALPLLALAAPLMHVEKWRRRLWPYFQRQLRAGEALAPVDMTAWHTYVLVWSTASCRFSVDGTTILTQPSSPGGPLGLVVWLDNQYRVVRPTGRLCNGLVVRSETQWMEIGELTLSETG